MPPVNIYLLILAYRDIQKLDQENIKEMFGVFYEEFTKKRKEGLIYMLIYLIRRFIFVGVALFMSN
jgi:hypothetical protein